MRRVSVYPVIIMVAVFSSLVWNKASSSADKQDDVYQKMALTYAKLCASCHGDKGTGGYGPSHINCKICNSNKLLYTKINNEMPLGNSSACVDDCALDMSVYIHDVLNGGQKKE